MLRRMLHRELSPEELERARQGYTHESRSNLFGVGTDTEYSMVGDEPQLRITERTRKTTRDLSHPEIAHTEFYNDRTTHYRYNSEGQLLEMCVQTGNIYDESGGMKFKVKRFSPPGSLVGQKVEQTERNYGMFG